MQGTPPAEVGENPELFQQLPEALRWIQTPILYWFVLFGDDSNVGNPGVAPILINFSLFSDSVEKASEIEMKVN